MMHVWVAYSVVGGSKPETQVVETCSQRNKSFDYGAKRALGCIPQVLGKFRFMV